MADINAKLKLTGEAAFTRGINDAKASVADLDKELELSKELFKKTGDKETYMRQKTQLLNEQIALQEQAVNEAKEALAQCAKQGFAENSRKVMTWRGKLAQAQTKLVSLYGELENNKKGLDENGKSYDDIAAKAQGFGEKVGGAESALASINRNVSLQNVGDAVKSINDTIDKGIHKVAQFGKALWTMTSDSTEWADDLATKSAQTGIDAETLQRWEYAARFIDTDVDAIISARKKLVAGMGKGGSLDESLAALGVSATDAQGALRDSYDVMWDVLAAMGNLDDEARDQKAMEIFGKSYQELIPLIQAGREEWDKWANKAPVVSEKDLAKLTEANDALEDLDANFETTQRTLLAQLAPALTSVANSLTGALQELGKCLESEEGQQKLQEFSDAMVRLAEKALDIDWGKVIEGVGKAFTAITDALGWIVDNWDMVKTILVAMAGLKIWGLISNAGTNAGKLWAGLKGLAGVGGGGGAAGAAGSAAGAGGTATTAAGGGITAKAAGAAKGFVASGMGAATLEVTGILVAAEAAVEGVNAAVDAQTVATFEARAAALAEKEAAEGVTENTQLATKLLLAAGPALDENGEYVRTGMFGWGYWTGTRGESRETLMGLKDRKNQERAQLYNLASVAPTVQGESVWTWLQRLWDPRYGLEDWEEDWQIDEGILDEVAEALVQATIDYTGKTPAAAASAGSSFPAAVLDTTSEAHDILMGLQDRKNQQLAQLRSALDDDAWSKLLRLWQEDNLTEDEVSELWKALTEADATLLETAQRRAVEAATSDAEQAAIDRLLGTQSRTGQQRAQLFAGLDDQQQRLLTALWGGGSLSAGEVFSLYGAVFGAGGVNLTRPGDGNGNVEEYLTADDVAGILASALSQADFDINGQAAGRIIAPTVADILARKMYSR